MWIEPSWTGDSSNRRHTTTDTPRVCWNICAWPTFLIPTTPSCSICSAKVGNCPWPYVVDDLLKWWGAVKNGSNNSNSLWLSPPLWLASPLFHLLWTPGVYYTKPSMMPETNETKEKDIHACQARCNTTSISWLLLQLQQNRNEHMWGFGGFRRQFRYRHEAFWSLWWANWRTKVPRAVCSSSSAAWI